MNRCDLVLDVSAIVRTSCWRVVQHLLLEHYGVGLELGYLCCFQSKVSHFLLYLAPFIFWESKYPCTYTNIVMMLCYVLISPRRYVVANQKTHLKLILEGGKDWLNNLSEDILPKGLIWGCLWWGSISGVEYNPRDLLLPSSLDVPTPDREQQQMIDFCWAPLRWLHAKKRKCVYFDHSGFCGWKSLFIQQWTFYS